MATLWAFKNRGDAGDRLAGVLARDVSLRNDRPIIVALPRGGVPVAEPIARKLAAPLEILIVRKIGAPFNREFGIGAMAEEGDFFVDQNLTRRLSLQPSDIEDIISRERSEVQRRKILYRGDLPVHSKTGRTVIVVDDGLATGATARVAALHLRKKGAARLILAVPVCEPTSAAELGSDYDEIVCLERPERFMAVSQFYRNFSEVTDEEVQSTLKKLEPQSEAFEAEERVHAEPFLKKSVKEKRKSPEPNRQTDL